MRRISEIRRLSRTRPVDHSFAPSALARRTYVFTLALAAAGIWMAARASDAPAAEPGRRELSTLEGEVRFQPPSPRLDAMGGLSLAVRDEYNELNLWDFTGLAIDLPVDRDSTSVDFWVDRAGRIFDQREGGVEAEVLRRRSVQVASEAVVRSGNLASGVDVGSFLFQSGAPASDGEHLTEVGSQPAIAPSIAGRLWGGLRWGFTALFGRETQDLRLWRDQLVGGRIEVTPKGDQAPAPNFFVPEAARASFAGLTASLGYRHARWGIGSLYLQVRHDDVKWNQSETRHLFELHEPRTLVGFGAAAVANLEPKIQVGATVGREYYSSVEKYRFTLSGGSTDSPLARRGDHSFHDHWSEYARLRGQADVPGLPLTLGAALRVAFDREIETAAGGHPSDFNSFILGSVAGDTLVAPSLATSYRSESRTAEFGGGASYRLSGDRATVGAEYRHFRDALGGTLVFSRSTGWEARAGAEYRFLPRWTGRAGYQHHREDADVNTPRNESLADRVSLGLERGGLFRKWTLQGQVYREWWRTDYPDPRETGGPGMGFTLLATREF